MPNTISVTNAGNTITVTRTGYTVTVYDGGLPAPSYVAPSYSNQYGSGDRANVLRNKMLVGSFGGAVLPQFATGGQYFDGLFSDVGYPNNAQAVVGDQVLFDLTGLDSDTFKITEMKFYFSAGTMNCGTWKPQELRDGVWSDIGASFVLGASNPTVIDCASSTGSSMFRIYGVSGDSSWNLLWQEVEFKIGAEV